MQITVLVNPTGGFIRDNITLSHVPHAGYAAKIKETVARTVFRPAVLNGCAVQGMFRSTLTFSDSPRRR